MSILGFRKPYRSFRVKEIMPRVKNTFYIAKHSIISKTSPFIPKRICINSYLYLVGRFTIWIIRFYIEVITLEYYAK
jgi:hypothetical protein